MDEEKKVCNFGKFKKKKDDSEEDEEYELIYKKRFNTTSLIYSELKKDTKDDKIYDIWKKNLKRKLLPKEHKEYKGRFDYLLGYYKEIIKDESKS